MKILNGRYGRINEEMKPFRYGNIFLVGSVLHAGNAVEYFSKHSKKLVVYYLLQTVRSRSDFVQVYELGHLVREYTVFVPKIPLLYYVFVYFWFLATVIRNFSPFELFHVITFHPIFCIGRSVLQKIYRYSIVFWMADYIPKPTRSLDRLFQRLVEFYHSGNDYTIYLGDSLNKVMNGRILKETNKKTVMWGVMPENISIKKKDMNNLAFVGVVKRSHGLDIVFYLLSQHNELSLKIFGECDEKLHKEYCHLIQELDIETRVTFENRFYTLSELKSELASCSVGLALYDTSHDIPIYYTDPGKVKTFTQYGLPVIMTRTSDIVPYIEKYTAGEVVDRNPEAVYDAIVKMRKSYSIYLDGVKKFNSYFDCEKYYKHGFSFME
ncbi:MAG: hypothetical protein AAB508_05725 [Patescibacteria group bacterium]